MDLDTYVLSLQTLAYDLCNITPGESWTYTPAELDLMFNAVIQRTQREDLKQDIRTARICMYLSLPYREGEVYLKEFMPGYTQEKEEQTPQDMESMIRVINTVFQGEEK